MADLHDTLLERPANPAGTMLRRHGGTGV